MGILNMTPEKITPARLRDRNFDPIRWGWGLQTYNHNSKAYEWYGTFNSDDTWADVWDMIYFPKKFEGEETLGLASAVDVRGRVVMHQEHIGADYYVSPVLDTMADLDVFTSLVLAGNYPNAYEMIENGDLKYI